MSAAERAIAEVRRLDALADAEPWVVDETGHKVYWPVNGDFIATIAECEEPANAVLIAHYRTAAPALANALESTLMALRWYSSLETMYPRKHGNTAHDALQAIDAALAAEGEAAS